MGKRKKLIISISNQPRYHGIMSVNFAIDFFGKKHPEKGVFIAMFELCDDKTIKPVCERINGKLERYRPIILASRICGSLLLQKQIGHITKAKPLK